MLFEAFTKSMVVASCQGCWCMIVRLSWFCGQLLVVIGCPPADPHLDSCLLQGAAMHKVSQELLLACHHGNNGIIKLATCLLFKQSSIEALKKAGNLN